MKTLRNFLILIIISPVFFTSCLKEIICTNGRGITETITLEMDDFTGIDLRAGANVTISQGDVQRVTVTGKENILDRLKTEVIGGNWGIDLGRACFNDLELNIDIVIPVIEAIHQSSSGKIVVEDFEDQANLDIRIFGSGDIELSRFSGTENVDILISGSGKVIAKDEFPDLITTKFELTGSGRFDGYPMVMKNFDGRISGSGNLYVNVTDNLNVRISGSGNVHYKGNPFIDANITGSGKIINEN